ncbi:MAG: molybdopterin dinucleotide binding domain-containing protein, partial [Angustibacter sp.]
RLRKAVRGHGQQVVAVAPWATRGLDKLAGRLLSSAPGTEAEVLDALATGAAEVADTAELLRAAGSVILVGERLASVTGGLSAAIRCADATGARLAWVPRRAGERGGVEAGALPGLLPGGRLVADPTARADVQAVWGSGDLPAQPGRDAAGILHAAQTGQVAGLVVGGVDPDDLPDPAAARAALRAASFVVCLEQRATVVTEHADVVLPVAAVAEKAGTFRTWEGRPRPFEDVLRSSAMSDHRVLHLLAAELDVDLGLPDIVSARAELAELAGWQGAQPPAPSVPSVPPPPVGPGQAVLSSWHQLLDAGRLQDGEPWLAGTARRPVARLSPGTAAEVGVVDGELVTVATDRGSITLPVVVTELPERVVWLPANQVGHPVRARLGADAGAVVTVRRAAGVIEGSGDDSTEAAGRADATDSAGVG